MADGANLELKFTASQDESVRQAFTAMIKLLTSLDKTMGSLSASVERLAGLNGKLKKSAKAVSDQNEEAAESYKKRGNAADKAAEQEKKAAEKATKEAERAAEKARKAEEKRQKEASRAAEKARKEKEREQQRIEREAKKAEREADRILEKERREAERKLKQQEKDADRLAKLEAKAKKDNIRNNFGDPVSSKTYMTNPTDTFNIMDMYHRKLEQINREDKRGTQVHGDKLVALQRTEDAFKRHLRPIDEALERKVRINDAIENLLTFKAANPELITPAFDETIERLQDKLAKLDTITNRQAFAELADSFDFQRNFEKNLKDIQKSRIFTETEKHIAKLGEYGDHAISIYKDLGKAMEDNSAQRRQLFQNVEKFAKYIDKTDFQYQADIATLSRKDTLSMTEEERKAHRERIDTLKESRAAFMDEHTSIGKYTRAFHAYFSSIKDETLPITNVQKYTEVVAKHGEEALSLFNALNAGLDENSERIKHNANDIDKFYTDINKKIANAEAQLEQKRKQRSTATTDKEIADLDKGIVGLEQHIDKLKRQVSDENILESFFGFRAGKSKILEEAERIVGGVDMFKTRLDEIKNTTIRGSAEQRDAIKGLMKDFKDYNSVLDVTSRLTAISANNLEELKRSNAAEDALTKHQKVARELENIRKTLTNTFSGVSDVGTSVNISKMLNRYSTVLTSATPFGDQARGLFSSDIDLKNLDSLEVKLGRIATQYNNVIPTLDAFRERHALTTEQVEKLTNAEFLEQASLQKTKAGVRKLAEEYLGFHKTSRQSITLFDRMASSMGNMARYAFGASIYYAFENAIFSTIDAVAQFDQSLKNLQAITDATDDEVAALGAEIKRVAVETKYGLNEVAEGATIIGQAGYSAVETMSILGSAMNLAQGSMSTVTASADLLTTILASFNLQASDAAMVADNMAAAMNYSKLDIDKLRTAFNYVGPVAMDAGASLQEMSAVLMVLANNGMKASTIGTSLRNVFSQLQSPSAALRKLFNELEDGRGEEYLVKLSSKSTPVVEKFKTLNEVLGTSSDLFKLFGLRAAGTVSILTKYSQQIEEMQQGLYTLGEADRMAEKQMEGLANRMANLGASMEVLGVTMTEQPSKLLSGVVWALTEAVKAFTEYAGGSLGSAITTFAGLAGAIGSAVVVGKLFSLVFGVTATSAIAKFGKGVIRTTAVIKAFTTATQVSTAASSGLVGTLLRFSVTNPVLAGLAAITAAIVALTAAYAVFSDKVDEGHQKFQQDLKNRRENIGLLRTAIDYNSKIDKDDDVKRARNMAYVAQQMPELAPSVLGITDADKLHGILSAKLRELEDETVKSVASYYQRTADRVDALEVQRINLGRLFTDKALPPTKAFTSVRSLITNDIYEDADKSYRDVLDRLRAGRSDMMTALSFLDETVRKDAEQIISNEGIGANDVEGKMSAWERAADRLRATLGNMSASAKEAFDSFMSGARTAFKAENNIAIATEDVASLSARLKDVELDGDAITKVYSRLGGNYLGYLVRDVQAAEKEYNKIAKAKYDNEKDRIAAIRLFQEQQNAKMIKGTSQTAQQEIQWSEQVRQQRIADINASTMTQEQKFEEIKRINEEMYADEETKAKNLLSAQVSGIVELNKLTGVDVDKTVNLLIEGNYADIDPELWRLILQGGFTSTITTLWNIVTKRKDNQNAVPTEKRFGVSAKRLFDADKNAYDKTIAELEQSYEFGSISNAEYTVQRIAAREALIAAEQRYVDALNSSITTEADYAQYKKAFEALEENKAKASYEAEKMRRDDALQALENSHNRKMLLLDQEAAAYENRDMDEQLRQMALLRIDERRTEQNMANINAELGLKISNQRRTELQLELDKERLNLAKSQVEQQRLAYEIRTKYIEQEYKYGLQTEQAYRDYIQKQQREGGMNPYDAQKEVWRISDSPLDGFRLGIMEISEATKTMNDYISEGVANFRDEWHGAIDEFVESWWDGTASASEIFGDFVNNIAMDWQKRILKMYSDRMFEGFARSFLGGELQGVYTQFGGGRPVVTTDDGLSDPTRTAPSWTSAIGVNTDSLALNVSASMQNMQSNLNAATNSMTADVSNMSNQSTSLLTSMTNGASSLWQFLANGFNGLWNNIGSGLSGLLASLSFATTASSGGSFFERWLGNSIGMGFQLYSMGGSIGGTYNGMTKADAAAAANTSMYKGMGLRYSGGSALGNVFKGLSGFSNSIVASPTLFTYGEHLKAFAKGAGVMGEAGPEAIMPLTRDGSGRLGVNASGMSPCINNIYIETPEGYTAEQTSRMSNDNGGEDIMFTIVKQTAANVAQPGSPMYRAMQNTFGASQVLTSR